MSKQNKAFLLHYRYNKYKDLLTIVMKDPDTKARTIYEVKKPTTPCWTLKPHLKEVDYFKEYEDMRNLDFHEVPANNREEAIAKIIGDINYLQDVKEEKIPKSDIYLNRRVFGGDYDVESWTVMKYLNTLKEGEAPAIEGNIDVGFLDIEIDAALDVSIKVRDQHKHAKKFPVNAITYIDAKTNMVYVYALKDKSYGPKLQEIIDDKGSFVKDVVDHMNHALQTQTFDSSKDNNPTFDILNEELNKLKYSVTFYDNDKDLIHACLTRVFHKSAPDFLQIFNASYDIGFLEARMKYLGMDKYFYFTHPDFKNKFVNFNYKDESPDAKSRRHSYKSSAYTQVIDQQIFWFGLRAQTKLDTESLNSVVKHVTKLEKTSFSHICDTMPELVRADYRVFLEYSIRDVIAQYATEIISKDIEAMLGTSMTCRSSPENSIKALPRVTGHFDHKAHEQGRVFSNEINKHLATKFKNIHQRSFNKLEKEYIAKHNKKPSKELVKKQMWKEAGRKILDVMANREAASKLLTVRHYINTYAPPIKGGYCSNPKKFKAKGVKILPTVYSMSFFEHLVDIDAKSQYPTTIIYNNASKTALYGKIVEVEDYTKPVYAFNEFVTQGDINSIGSEFFNLPTLGEVAAELGLGEIVRLDEYKRPVNSLVVTNENKAVLKDINNILKSLDSSIKSESPSAGQYMIGSSLNEISYKDMVLDYTLESNDLNSLYGFKRETTVDGRELNSIIEKRGQEIEAGGVELTCYEEYTKNTEYVSSNGTELASLDLSLEDLITIQNKGSQDFSINKLGENINFKITSVHLSIIKKVIKDKSDVTITVCDTNIDSIYNVKLSTSLKVNRIKDRMLINFNFNIIS